MWFHHRIPRLLPQRLHYPVHKFVHERTGWPWGPWGYFGCRICDEEWLNEHPDDHAMVSDGTEQRVR